MYAQSFLVTSVRGKGFDPTTSDRAPSGCSGFMKAALGLRAVFLAGFFAAIKISSGKLTKCAGLGPSARQDSREGRVSPVERTRRPARAHLFRLRRVADLTIGRVGERRATSWNPAFTNADDVPVQAKASGIRWPARGSTGYPSTRPAPRRSACSTAAFS